MRLTLVAPLVTPLRAAQLGGAQAVVADLARGLVERGEEVEVVAAPGSSLPGVTLRRAPGGPFPAELVHVQADGGPAPMAAPWPEAQAATYLRIAGDLAASRPDVVHAHALDWPSFYAFTAAGLPTVHTLHLGPVDRAAAEAARAAGRSGRRRPRFVLVSAACAQQWRGIVPIDAVIGNGVDPATIPFKPRPQADLAIVAGRIAPEKGTHIALAAARRAGMRVLLVGSIYDRSYFDGQVEPLIDDGVDYVGPVSRRRLAILYGRAAVALVASLWEEPFGMVALEANLAGTPVAGFVRGALPEVVGTQGGALTANATVAALAAVIPQAAALDRAAVRRAAERRHPLSRTLDAYQRLYADIAAGNPA